jgi:hypothetical protein
MGEISRVLRGALLFKTPLFGEFSQRSDVFFRGFVIVVLVALIGGIPSLIIDVANGIRGTVSVPAESHEVSSGFTEALTQLRSLLAVLPEEQRNAVVDQIRQGFEMGVDIAVATESQPTLLPRPIGRVLSAFGGWFSRPFAATILPLAAASLATWLGYGLFVMLTAGLLGGRSDIAGFLGTTSLYSLPHLLNVFAVVGVFGPLVWFVAFVWGVAIYVKATAVSHEISLARAVVAVLLPAVVLALALGMLLILALLVLSNLLV